eukprot:822964-Pelagomonas_calceolata.AAC.6
MSATCRVSRLQGGVWTRAQGGSKEVPQLLRMSATSTTERQAHVVAKLVICASGRGTKKPALKAAAACL